MERRNSKQVQIADLKIGASAPISVQSMTNTDTRDAEATVKQIKRLEKAGCELVRIAIPDQEAVENIEAIKAAINIPLVADIHFDYKLALAAMKRNIDGLRINPGNIGNTKEVKEIAEMANKKDIPIRVGVNAGSLEKKLLEKYGQPTAEAMVESALKQIELLEKFNFRDIIISLKASEVQLTLSAYRLMADKVEYPFHVGITEAGTVKSGKIKSAVGIGAVLAQGLGDTIRVSLTGDPVEEVKVGFEILKSLGLREYGIEIISCPTCGRCEIDLVEIANQVETKLENVDKQIQVAIMGCIVNGPGEAKGADIGIAGGKNQGLIFKDGEVLKKVAANKLFDELLAEIEKI